MIRSMTGFGREQRVINEKEISVEIRSVNHRYHEFSAKIPYRYRYFEDRLKSLISGKVSRGKVEVSVTVVDLAGKEVTVIANRGLVESYLNAIRALPEEFSIKDDDISLSDLLRIPDAFTAVKSEVDEDALWEAVSEVASVALEKFIAMREAEGAKMKSDILQKLNFIEKVNNEISLMSPQINAAYYTKLLEKMNEVIGAGAVDEQRIALEAAVFAEKTAIDEETVRLKSHIAQCRELLENENVVGRKLDFIVQEMNREVNTIGSKAHEIDVTRMVVDLKSEIEKMREQIQNIE